MFISKPLPGDKGARLAFGLEWRAYDAARSGEQRRRYAAELLATHYVETKVGNETVGGFCAPEKGDLSGARLYSAAARIAALERVRTLPAVLVLIEHESQVLTVFVVRGAVRSDEVLTLQAAHGRRTEIAKLCDRNGWSLAVFGAGDGIGQVDAPVGLHELMADRKAGRIAKLPVRLGGSVVALGVVGAALFMVFKGWDMISPPPPAPAPKSYQDLYHEAVVAEFGQGQPLASALAPDLLAQLGRMETNRAGWQFKSAECDNRGACSVKWNREGGTFVDFDLAAPKDWRPIHFDADGLNLTTIGPAVKVHSRITQNDASRWPSFETLKERLQTESQRLSTSPEQVDGLGYKVTIRDPQSLLSQPAPPGTPTGVLIKRGTWEIDGYRWQTKLLEELPPDLTLDSLSASLTKDGFRFHAKGKYYVVS